MVCKIYDLTVQNHNSLKLLYGVNNDSYSIKYILYLVRLWFTKKNVGSLFIKMEIRLSYGLEGRGQSYPEARVYVSGSRSSAMNGRRVNRGRSSTVSRKVVSSRKAFGKSC